LAASVQAVTEDVLVKAARWLRGQSECSNLLLGGGVALNCVANSRIAREAGFENLWILPNPGDAGSSLGAAAAARGASLDWDGPYLGLSIEGNYPVESILNEVSGNGVVGVASGRSEFGPRALGNRSILADPREAEMKERVNQIKGRELFRPFAPIIREERASEYFDLPVKNSPYMQFVARCLRPDEIPAVVHVDGTSRVQTVSRSTHAGLYELLLRWEETSGCAVLLNTSLNGRGEPLVNTWEEGQELSARTKLPMAEKCAEVY
jgi:carbamoyltransferase